MNKSPVQTVPRNHRGHTSVSAFDRTIQQLKEKTRKKGPPPIEAFKRFRKINEHRLRIAHNGGAGGRDLARSHSDVVDVIFRELAENIAMSLGDKRSIPDLAVVAFGGYGRREMNPFSDVDIMFLMPKANPTSLQADFIRQITTALWDIGFKVGNSVRSIPQAIAQANSDLLTKTSMIECRYLAGDRNLFNMFREQFELSSIKGRESEYLGWRLQNQKELHTRFGGTVFMQEPNVKSGRGGLRDVQNLLWIAYVKEHAQSLSRLVELSILRETERRKLEAAYDFLLRVRTEMHYLNGRAIDNLTLQLQGRVATAFGYPQKNMVRRCEAFMRDYYSHTRNIQILTEAAMDRMNLNLVTRRRSLLQIFKKPAKGQKFDGFIAQEGLLHPESRDIFQEDPHRMMRLFQHAQLRQLDLSGNLKDLIRRRIGNVDRTFQYARANREVFLAILSRKGEVGRILRLMHDTGFLGKYIPEFGALTNLVQHEFFHRYTADEHTLVCVEKLDSVLFSKERKLAGYRALFQRLEDPAVLYLSILLHDTGKAANSRHHDEASAEMSRKVARRIQLSPERRRMLITLVDSHISLSKTAQTRNLDDPVTVTEFASVINNRPLLDSLMLLTLADGMGTSDENWSDWKESLVWQLYRQTVEFLEEGPASFDRKKQGLQNLRQSLQSKLPKDFASEIEAHFEQMPERYFQAFDAAQIREHLRMFRNFFQGLQDTVGNPLSPVVRWIDHPEQGHTEVWVCGWDRPALLERLAGSFVAAGMNILSADVFTRSDHAVIDIFRVCDMRRAPVNSAKDRKFFEQTLNQSLTTQDFDLRSLFKRSGGLKFYRLSQEIDIPTRVVIENRLHPKFTLVEIQTPDRPGLLYDLLCAFHRAGVSIELSRITTEMDVALDTFYVNTLDGKKITEEEQIAYLQKLLQNGAVGRKGG